jgi:hypothetical protein
LQLNIGVFEFNLHYIVNVELNCLDEQLALVVTFRPVRQATFILVFSHIIPLFPKPLPKSGSEDVFKLLGKIKQDE